MPKFVIERDVPGFGNLSDAQLREMSQMSVKVLKEMGPQIQWLHSYVTGDKMYCVYFAPDEATIQEHARREAFPPIASLPSAGLSIRPPRGKPRPHLPGCIPSSSAMNISPSGSALTRARGQRCNGSKEPRRRCSIESHSAQR